MPEGPKKKNQDSDPESEFYTGRVKYTDSMADHYLKKSEGRRGPENAVLKRILQQYGVGKTLLDAPCGVARVGALLDGSDFRYFGADYSRPMLERARERLRETTLQYDLLHCDLEQAPFGSRSFDTTLSLRFLHHLPTKTRSSVLHGLARVTDRLLIVTFFHPFSLHYVMRNCRSLINMARGGEPSGRYSHTARWLEEQVKPQGFRLSQVYSTGFLKETRYAVLERT